MVDNGTLMLVSAARILLPSVPFTDRPRVERRKLCAAEVDEPPLEKKGKSGRPNTDWQIRSLLHAVVNLGQVERNPEHKRWTALTTERVGRPRDAK